MEILTQTETDKFIASLNGRPMLFAKSVNISKPSDTQESNTDEQDKPWTTSFSMTATMNSSEIDSLCVRKLLGLHRPQRGSSRNAIQRLRREVHYIQENREAFKAQKETLREHKAGAFQSFHI